MIRRIFILGSALICAATICLWPQTLRTAYGAVVLTCSDTWYSIQTHPGGLDVTIVSHFNAIPSAMATDMALPPKHVSAGWATYTHSWVPETSAYLLASVASDPVETQSEASTTDAGRMIVESCLLASPSTWYPPHSHLLGLGWESITEDAVTDAGAHLTRRSTNVALPLWVFALSTALPVTLALGRTVRHQRRLRGNRCTNCGYDVRASPGRCPECGETLFSPRPFARLTWVDRWIGGPQNFENAK